MKQLIEIIFAHVESISIPIFVLSSLIGTILSFISLLLLDRLQIKKISVIQYVLTYLYIVSLCFLYQVTFYNREEGSRIGIQLIPFTRIIYNNEIHLKNFLYAFFNIFLFLPYGFIVRFIFEAFAKERLILKSFFLCVLTTLIIELSQLIFEKGYFETEDLVCNSIGGITGIILAQYFLSFYHFIINKFILKKQE